jgi:hypothetical protein
VDSFTRRGFFTLGTICFFAAIGHASIKAADHGGKQKFSDFGGGAVFWPEAIWECGDKSPLLEETTRRRVQNQNRPAINDRHNNNAGRAGVPWPYILPDGQTPANPV